MKLLFLITALTFQVSAAVLAQSVSINCNKVALAEVMLAVQKQSGYNFLAESEYLKNARPVTVNLKNASVENALQTIFADQPFTYEIDGKMITLQPKKQGVANKVISFFSAIAIRGKVTDPEGNALPGATVKAGGKTVVTDGNGEFYIDGVGENSPVVISYLGYLSQTLKAGSVYLNITLQMVSSDLQEITINKGYYTTTKELNTGNVSTISSKDLSKTSANDPLIALSGRVPGLHIYQPNGVTGTALSIKLRGNNSLRTGAANDPLYVVNGVPYTSQPMSLSGNLSGAAGSLSPFVGLQLNDIESIDILKDADATAIYGSRGANGVILITTKKGKQGKTKVNINVSQGIGKVANQLDFLNSQEYVSMRRQALANDGLLEPGPNDNDLNGKWGDINQYTDWQKVMISGTAQTTNAQASISGGTEQTQFLLGGSYRRETTVFPGDFRDVKASANFNLNHISENKRFTSNISASYVNDNNFLPFEDYTRYIALAPNAPLLYNPDGSLNWQNSTWTNPLRSIYQSSTNLTTNLNTSLNLNYEVISGLTASLRSGYNLIRLKADQLTPLKGTNPNVTQSAANRAHRTGNTEVKTWIIEPTINYATKLPLGKIEALLGATWQMNDQSSLAQSFTGFASDGLLGNLSAAPTILVVNNSMSTYHYNAIYARLGYNYEDEYLINFTGRRDASSRFGPNNQFANFGAIGAAWIFSKQRFAERIAPFLSFGKIRTSYGITGNDQIGDYGFISTYSADGTSYQGVPILEPSQLTNANYGWESVKKLEAGLDLGFFNNRIFLGVSWYRNRTGNQLVGLPLPEITGFPDVQANLPALLENRGTEIELTSTNISTSDLKWTTTVNLTIPKSKLLKFEQLAGSGYATRYQVGQPLTVDIAYQFTGIDPETGTYTFEDVDKSGTYTAVDKFAFFKGQRFFGGMNNSFSYKGFQLDIFAQFVKQNGGRFGSNVAPGRFSDNTNQIKTNIPNTEGNNGIQKLTQNSGGPAQQAYTRFIGSNAAIVDASFIRLKNVELSWTLPAKYCKVIRLQTARIFAQGQNLFTITGYKGLDPESGTTGTGNSALKLPPLRVITTGLQITL